MTISATQVQEAYLAYFGRPADAGGLAYWQTQSDVSTMDVGFAASTEYANLYANMNSTQRVTQVYQDVLGRAPDTAGLNYWSGQLDAGSQTISSLVATILNAVLTEPAGGTDINTIDNRLTYAASFTTAVSASAADIASYSGTAASNAARVDMSSVVDTTTSLTEALNTLATSIANLTPSSLDISGYTGIHNLSTTTPAVSILNINSSSANASLLNMASAVTINDNNSNDSSTLTLTHAGVSQNNSVAVNFNGGGNLTLNSTSDSSVVLNTPTGGGNSVTFTISETDNALSSLTITGGDQVTLGTSWAYDVNGGYGAYPSSAISDTSAIIATGAIVVSSLTKIDASATTEGVTIYAGATIGGASSSGIYAISPPISGVSYSGLVIYGGTGGDTITNYADNGSIVAGVTPSTNTYYGYENSFFLYGKNASINDSNSLTNDYLALWGPGDSATLGGGSATVNIYTPTPPTFISGTVYTTGTDSIVIGSGSATINDHLGLETNANGNILALSGPLNNVILNLNGGSASPMGPTMGAISSVSAAQTLDQAIILFTGSTHSGNFEWFQYGGNTYIEHSGSTYAETVIVKLTGLVDLTHATVVNGTIYL